MNKKVSVAVIIFLMLVIGGLSVLLVIFYSKSRVAEPLPVAAVRTVKPSKVVEKADTTDWKLYRNEAFGYELKYPADWEIGTTFGADPYSFSAPDFSPTSGYAGGAKAVPSFSLSSIHKLGEGETLETDMPLGNPDGRIIEKKMIKVDGRNALFVEYFKNGYGDPNGKTGRVQQQIKVIDGGAAYHLELQEYNQVGKLLESSAQWENKAVLEAILASFKFLENNKVSATLSGPVSKELLYTNEKYGFSVALPAGWEKYQVSVQRDKGDDKHTYLYFLLPTSDKNFGYFDKNTGKIVKGSAEIFVITATDLNTWNNDVISKECIENPNPECPNESSVVGKDEKYVFTADYGNGLLPEDVQKFVADGSAAEFLDGKFKLLD